jgi:tight adherence protein B
VAGSIALFFLFTFVASAGVMALFRLVPSGGKAVKAQPAESRVDIYDAEILRDEALSTISIWDRLLKRFDWVEIMKKRIQEAGMDWSVGRLTMFMLVAGSATFVAFRLMVIVPGWLVVVLAGGAAAAPYLVVLRRRSRRLRKLEQQLPDALDTLARALRAGHPVQVALEILAREVVAPLAFEFRKLADERALGMPLEDALDNLCERVPVSEISEFAAAVQMQSRTGGKLHEVLARLSENMRESEALKMEIESISAHGKMTGLILTLMPIGIGVILAYTNPSQMAILWGDELGRNLIGAAGVCLVLAHVVIRKLVDIRI